MSSNKTSSRVNSTQSTLGQSAPGEVQPQVIRRWGVLLSQYTKQVQRNQTAPRYCRGIRTPNGEVVFRLERKSDENIADLFNSRHFLYQRRKWVVITRQKSTGETSIWVIPVCRKARDGCFRVTNIGIKPGFSDCNILGLPCPGILLRRPKQLQ